MQQVQVNRFDTITEDIKKIMYEVFCNEQGFTYETVFDCFTQQAFYVTLSFNQKTFATARFYMTGEDSCKIGKIAVLPEQRAGGYGRLLVGQLLNFAAEKGVCSVVVGAQQHAIGFYQKLGFKQQGEIFFEDDRKIYPMVISL
ncbi:MAG: GNAT family N-acetyltransferase [bacterium]|nr:GNAT family N-acetyltransferase [bacterium]